MFLLTSCKYNNTKKYIREYDSCTIIYSKKSSNPRNHLEKKVKLDDELFNYSVDFIHNYLKYGNNHLQELGAGWSPLDRYWITFTYGDNLDFFLVSANKPFISGTVENYDRYNNDSSSLFMSKKTFDDIKELLSKYEKVLEEVEWVDEEWLV